MLHCNVIACNVGSILTLWVALEPAICYLKGSLSNLAINNTSSSSVFKCFKSGGTKHEIASHAFFKLTISVRVSLSLHLILACKANTSFNAWGDSQATLTCRAEARQHLVQRVQ